MGSEFLPADENLFYTGITFKHADDSASFSGVTTLGVNEDDFYLNQNSPNTDEATLNFRGNTDTLVVSETKNTYTNVGRLNFADNQFYIDSSLLGDPVVNLNAASPEGILQLGHAYDGSILDPVTITVTSDGSTITFNATPSVSPVRTLLQGVVRNWTPAAFTVTPAGSDTAPAERYIWVQDTAGTMTITEGSNWPLIPHVRLARVIVQTAAGTQTNGPLKVHAYTDHVSEGAGTADKPRGFVGHIHSVGRKLRFNADWQSGIALTVTQNTTPTPDDIYVATTAGVVFQLHEHDFPALDSDPAGGNDSIYVINDPTTAYTAINSLSEITQDANGNSFGVTARFNVVLWGVVNEASGDCKYFLNLPALSTGTAQYTGDDAAIVDSNQTAIYTVPNAYRGIAFLIARITLKRSGGGNTWESINEQDLRGTSPQAFAAGSTVAGGEVNTASNLGTGEGVFAAKVDLDLTMKSLIAGNGVTLSSDANEITINASGGNFTGPVTGEAFYMPGVGELSSRSILPAGTAAAPTYSFTNDPDMGMFAVSVGILGFSVGGSDAFRVSPTEIQIQPAWNITGASSSILMENGIAGAPSFAFDDDPNTGMFRPLADAISFSCGGSELIRIRENGASGDSINLGAQSETANRVGINLTAINTRPSATLHVGGNGLFENGKVEAAGFYLTSGGELASASNPANGDLLIYDNGSYREIRLDPDQFYTSTGGDGRMIISLR